MSGRPEPRPAWDRPEDAAEYGPALLRGERVRLRPLREADVPVLEEWWNDPATMALQGDLVRPVPSGGHAEVVRGWSRNDSASSVGFSVVDREEGRLVGHTTLWGMDLRGRCADFALQLGPDDRGRGLGADTVRTVLRYAFAELGLHRVQLGVYAYNTRAVRAYLRAGFVEEGRRREVVFHDGRWHDLVLMSVLEHEHRS